MSGWCERYPRKVEVVRKLSRKRVRHKSGPKRPPVRQPRVASVMPAAVVVAGRESGAAELSAGSAGPLDSYVKRIAPEVVAVTYWFDPLPTPPVQSFTVRVTGRRVDVVGRPAPGDAFTHDEPCTGVVAGSGPVAVTVKVRDVNPGEWTVDGRLLPVAGRVLGSRGGAMRTRQGSVPVFPADWSWWRWRVSAAPPVPVATRLAPFVRPPAILIGSWPALVVLGVVLALVTQAVVIAADALALQHVLLVSLLTVLAGAVGAKAWFIVLHRRERRREGWCIQGLMAAVVVVAPVLLAVLHMPIGVFLDASAPGLLVGLAVGRLGCFFTGCCAGRPTARRWGVWSSNRSVGARRIPTQLMESTLALGIGLLSLAAVLAWGVHHGTVFVAAVTAYTLGRQGLLLLREERRQSRLGTPLIAAAAAVILLADVAASVVT